MTGRQFLNSLDHRMRAGNIIQGEKAIQRIDTDPPLHCGMFKESFDFGCEADVGSRPIKIQRLDAQTVACKDQAALRFSPKRKPKHSPQSREAICVPFAKSRQNNLCIT